MSLTDTEKSLLDKGLKFVPPKKLNTFSTFIDVQKCIHKLSIQRHFLTQPPRSSTLTAGDGNVHSGLSNPSLFNPPGSIAPSINVFRSLVLQDLDKLPNKRVNINPTIKCEHKNLTICPADKSGGLSY